MVLPVLCKCNKNRPIVRIFSIEIFYFLGLVRWFVVWQLAVVLLHMLESFCLLNIGMCVRSSEQQFAASRSWLKVNLCSHNCPSSLFLKSILKCICFHCCVLEMSFGSFCKVLCDFCLHIYYLLFYLFCFLVKLHLCSGLFSIGQTPVNIMLPILSPSQLIC